MSDRELQRAESLVDADDWTDDDIGDAACVLERCVAELRERRAADLTDVDRAALKYFTADIRALRGCIPAGGYTEHVLAVLDRLLNGGE